MSEDNIGTEHRRKRIKRLKKCIILMVAAVLVLPLIVSACVLAEVYSLRKTLEDVSAQMNRLTLVTAGQQETLQQLTGKLLTVEQKLAEISGDEIPTEQQPPEKTTEVTDPAQEENINSREPKETVEVSAAHKVYLTFDDGPSIYTQDILDILDRYDVKATFFVLGREKESYKEMLKSIAEDGHTIGMHSYSHKYSEIYSSVENFAEDLEKIQNYIYETTGIWSTVYRFPGGSSNSVSQIPMDTFARYLDEQGIVFFDWNSASGDGKSSVLSVETLVENSMKGILKRDSTVILMHDAASKKTTVDALPILIENILALEDTVILPITENTKPVQHINWSPNTEEQQTE